MKMPVVMVGLLAGTVAIAQAESPWWAAFGNEILSGFVEAGLASHPDPAAALARVEAARHERQRVTAAKRPAAGLDLTLRAGREKTMYTDREPGNIDPLAGAVRISWEVDLFGRVRHAAKAAAARGEMSDADLRGVRLLLGTEIAHLVFDVSELQQVAAIEREIEDTMAQLDRRVRARARAGLDAQPAADRARARYDMAQHMRTLTEIRLEKVLNRLNSLVGMTVVPERVPQVSAFVLPPAPAFNAETRMGARPDVMSAWWRLQGFLSETEAAKRASAPTVALVASAAGEASEDGAEPWAAWVGPGIQLPLWRPDLRAVKRRARAESEAARAQFESVSLTAMREIADARVDRVHAEQMIAHLAERRASLANAESVEKRRREAGLTREDEWLEARITHWQALREMVAWQKSALVAHVELVKALGG